MKLEDDLQAGQFVFIAKAYDSEKFKVMVIAKDIKEAVQIAQDYYKTNLVHVKSVYKTGTPNVYLI
jgi:hypothetical protein